MRLNCDIIITKMKKTISRSGLKALSGSFSSDKDIKTTSSKSKIIKKKSRKSSRGLNSDLMLSDRQNESDNNLSTNMAGNTSASMSTFPEKESDQSETSMRVDSKTRHKRELSVDKIPTGFGASKNKKNRSERVVVHVRMRPFSKNELEKSKKSAIARFDTDTNLVSIYKDKAEGVKSKFYFDSLFHDNATQEEVYEVSGRRVVDSVINGFNGTIFAYGQTGTGKTFTMLGDYLAKGSDKIDQGIIPRSLSHVFEE